MQDENIRTRKRGRGRPRSDENDEAGIVTREAIIDHAYEQARSVSFDELSFVQLARDLGVVAGSLHYHIGTKDDLNSALLNRFFHGLLNDLKRPTADADWRDSIRFLARTMLRHWKSHVGAALHIQTKARFRIFQRVAPGQTDYGAAFLDLAFDIFRKAGFSPSQTALFYHAMAMHCLATANSDVVRLEPAAHERFLRAKAGEFPAAEFPGLAYALESFAEIRMDETFELGLEALLDRFGLERGQAETAP